LKAERDRYRELLEQAVLELDDWRVAGDDVMSDLAADFVAATKGIRR
jgi:hypothetical protein